MSYQFTGISDSTADKKICGCEEYAYTILHILHVYCLLKQKRRKSQKNYKKRVESKKLLKIRFVYV